MDSQVAELSVLYKERAAKSRDWIDYLKAHGLANACLCIEPTEQRQKAVYDLEKSWYDGKHPLTYSEHEILTNKHKRLLRDYRQETKTNFDSLKDLREHLNIDDVLKETAHEQVDIFCDKLFEMSKKCSTDFVKISHEVMQSSVNVLSRSDVNPPCSFAVIGLGSVARGEATPYSDLEYAFLVESASSESYFKSLAVESYFQINNVGETPLKSFHIKELSSSNAEHPKAGYRIDGITPSAGNIPTGNGSSQSLILTVDELVKVYCDSLSKSASELAPLSDLLSSSALIYSNEGGKEIYQESLIKLSDALKKDNSSTAAARKRVEMISVDVERYQFVPEFKKFGPPDNSNIKVKTDIFRYPTLLANHIRLALALESCYPWNTIQTLETRGVLPEIDCRSMKLLLALCIYIRTSAYLAHGTQIGKVSLYTTATDSSTNIYHVPRNIFVLIGCLVVPLKHAVKSNLARYLREDTLHINNNESIVSHLLTNLSMSETKPLMLVEVLFYSGDHDGALNHLYQTFGEDSINRYQTLGEDSINRNLSELLKVVSEYKGFKSEIHFVEMCCYLLCSARKYFYALTYFNWLISHEETSDIQIIRWKILTADCLNKIYNYVKANDLLTEVVQMLRRQFTIRENQSLPVFVLGELKNDTEFSEIELAMFEVTAHAYKVIGETYQHLKFSVQAADVTKRTLHLFESLLGRDVNVKRYSVSLFDSQGSSYLELGQFVEAETWFNKALDELNTLHGENSNHPDMATVHCSIARLYQQKGEYKIALDRCMRSLNINKHLYRESSAHLDVAASYGNVADIYCDAEDYHRALDHYTKAVKMVRDVHQNDINHIDLITPFRAIANVHRKLENYTVALEYLTKVQQIMDFCSQFTGSHPLMAGLLGDIGKVHSSKGDRVTALQFNTKSLEMMNLIYNKVDVKTAALTNLYPEMGEFSGSLESHTTQLNIMNYKHEANLNHPQIAECHRSIGGVHCDMGEYKKALEYYTKALDIQKVVYGDSTEHPSIAISYFMMGQVYSNMGEYCIALEYHTKALDIQKVVYGDSAEHPNIAISYSSIGQVCNSMAKYGKALEYYTKALDIQKVVYGDSAKHPSIAVSYSNICQVYSNMGEYSKASEYNTKALDIQQAVFGDSAEHRNTAVSYSNSGKLWLSMGEYSKALEYYTKALDILRVVYGDNAEHPSIAINYRDIGEVYSKMGEYSKALEYYTKALDILRVVYGDNAEHPSIATNYRNIGGVYSNMGEYGKALEYYTKALDIQKVVYGDSAEHPSIAISYFDIGQMYNSMAKYSKGLATRGRNLGRIRGNRRNTQICDYYSSIFDDFPSLNMHSEIAFALLLIG